jgi:tetratricopeptide (TPR) repeat protein
MPATFDLDVATDAAALSVDLRLRDTAGNQIAWTQIRLADYPSSRWEGLFDLRRYVRRYADNVHPLRNGAPMSEGALVRELGTFLGGTVLGEQILRGLATGIGQRTLRVHLPGPQAGSLAAAFGRVPWEIARAAADSPSLGEMNVLVRVLAGTDDPSHEPLSLALNDSLRVLAVFAEAPGSRPLAMRLEHQQLLHLFHREVFPRRRVKVDVLCHGVTRERLVRRIEDAGGYHVLHWSGHGHLNLLELYGGGNEPDRLTGQELADLFARSGGYVPRLVFLSACHSGDLLNIRDWAAFRALVEGQERRSEHELGVAVAEPPRPPLQEEPSYTGTAHALLEAGIPTVVAMRYEVGPDYARDLASAFYQRLLGDERPKRADEALNQARRALFQAARDGKALGYDACDHATPVLYGAADPGLPAADGQTEPPVVHPPLATAELQPHQDFVGRTWELASLGSSWLDGQDQRPVAVIRGLGGLGKTALAAEVVGLWHERFQWIFPFQAKPVALVLDAFLHRLHATWMEQQGAYAQRVAKYPAEAIWRRADADFTGERRQEVLRSNLVRALTLERVLLLLDNFESALTTASGTGGSDHACQDPAWDATLAALAEGLTGTRSRVLITSRWSLAAFQGSAHVMEMALGPLPPGEAALYVRSHRALRALYFQKQAGAELIRRLLQTSRGHPLLLDRLGRLANGDRAALENALGRLETEGIGKLPEVFAANPADPEERQYLEYALTGSIDLLLERSGDEARRLLWVLSLANEPVTVTLLREVWESAAPAIDMDPLLRKLLQIGLTQGSWNDDVGHLENTCHETVRERVWAWMDRQPTEMGEYTREQAWSVYGERLAKAYQELVAGDRLADAVDAGSRALRYVVRAGNHEALAQFASELILSTTDLRVLNAFLPELEHAAASAPLGNARWTAQTCLADVLGSASQPDASLAYYAAAAAEAETAEHWSDLAWITSNWAGALSDCGHLQASRDKYRESARHFDRGGRPALDVLANELAALSVDISLNQAAEALPEIESRLKRIRDWWERARRGEDVPEAPDREALGRTLIGALGIAADAHLALEQWELALDCIGKSIDIKRARGAPEHDIAESNTDRSLPLCRLGRLDEAQKELDACLKLFTETGNQLNRARALSALAEVYEAKGDPDQAIGLARRALTLQSTLPHSADRAASHNNLGRHLERGGHETEALAQAMAALLYSLVIGHSRHLKNWARGHIVRLRQAQQSGRDHALPRVSEFVARPDFAPLRDWLAAREVDLVKLQEQVDGFEVECRADANAPHEHI